MTNFYADRGTLFINSKQVADIKDLKLTIDESISRVDNMSANKRSSGYRKGNRKVSLSFSFDLPDNQAKPDLSYQYGNDISVVAAFGASGERYSVIGIVQNSADLSSSVGDASKSISCEAIDAINENGAAVNAQIGF